MAVTNEQTQYNEANHILMQSELLPSIKSNLHIQSDLELTSEQQQSLIAHWDDPHALYRHAKEKFVSTTLLRRRLRARQQVQSEQTEKEIKEEEADPLAEWHYVSLCVVQLLSLNDENISYHLLAIQIYQSYPEPHSPKGTGYQSLAIRSCEAGIRLCRAHLEGHHESFYLWITTFFVLRAQILFQQREWKQVISSVAPALEYRMSDNIHLLYNLRASAHCELKDFDAAICDYGLAIETADEPSSYHNSRGTCWHELGQFDAALDDYNVAIGRNKQCVSAFNNRASLFVDMGKYQEALQDANRGLAIYSNHGNLYKHRAVAHFHLCHYGECLLDLQQSITFAPQYRPARVTLKMVWDFYFGHLAEYIQQDVCRVVVDYAVGDNYQTDEWMVDATYADWKKEIALIEEDRRREEEEETGQTHTNEGGNTADAVAGTGDLNPFASEFTPQGQGSAVDTNMDID